jgi:hypothetical protein
VKLAMSPAMRRNLIFLLLGLTILAAIFVPDESNEQRRPLVNDIEKSHADRAAPASPVALANLAGSLQPNKRLALQAEPKDIFLIKKPLSELAEKVRQAQRIAPPAPTAPPLPFVYMGKILNDGNRAVFLTRNDKPYIARAGDVLDGTYRVDAIQPPTLELTYLPLSQKQTLDIGEEK